MLFHNRQPLDEIECGLREPAARHHFGIIAFHGPKLYQDWRLIFIWPRLQVSPPRHSCALYPFRFPNR